MGGLSTDQVAPGPDPAREGKEGVPVSSPDAEQEASLALETVRAADHAGVGIRALALVAVLATDGVRLDLMHAAGHAGALAPAGHQVTADAVDDILAGLADRSLLTLSPDGRTVGMTQPAAAVTRSWLAGPGRLASAGLAAAAALEAWARTFGATRDQAAVRDMPGQVTALASQVDALEGQDREELATRLLRLRFLALYYLIVVGDNARQAIAVGEPLTADLEQAMGADHPATLNARNSLAAAYLAADRPAEAVPLFQRTLLGRERTLGPDHPDTLISQNNLAAAYQDAGRVDEAIRLFRLTLAARERRLGASHRDTLTSRANLAAVCRTAGRAAEAIPLLDQVGQEAAEPPEVLPPAEASGIDEPRTGPPPEPQAREPETRKPEEEAPRVAVPPPVLPPAVPGPRLAAEPEPAAARSPGRRKVGLPRVVTVVLVLIIAAGAAGALSRLHSGDHSPGPAGNARTQPADPAQLAADWVAQQVSRSVTVACDPLMCAALEARGVPTARLLVLRAGTASPRGAGVVVATPAIRNQFGSRLDSEYAPAVIAGFGSGAGQVQVEVVAPDGAPAYRAALRQDQSARKAAGPELLANKQIVTAARARAQLAAGLVDARLLILLPTLAATHPVQVLDFGSGPGAGSDSPLCAVDLSGSGRAAGMTDAAYQSWLTSFVRAQLNHFTGTVAVIKQDGQPVVRIDFTQPSPLGLLSAQ